MPDKFNRFFKNVNRSDVKGRVLDVFWMFVMCFTKIYIGD